MTAATPGPMSPATVFGPFTGGQWKPIAADASAGDDEKAAASSAERSLGDELRTIANAEFLVVLAGAGCSFSIGPGVAGATAPMMSDLWHAVEKIATYAKVKAMLSPAVTASGNLEHVLSDAQARLALNPSDQDLASFVREAEDIVWTRCNFVDQGSALDKHQLFLRKVARRSTRLQRTQIFTTNYDRAFEEAARRSRFNVIDGFGYGGRDFDGGSFDLDYVRRHPHEQLTLEPNVFHLLKLHGSVDWNDDGGAAIQKVAGKPSNPVLIYPSSTKYQLSYRQPYLEFMSRFQIALRQPDVGLIVAGFGFNDDHLNAPIEAAIRSNSGLRAIVVTPSAKSAPSATIGWIQSLIELGDRRLTLLNATFDEMIKVLPDTPDQDDRDAHADRIASSGRGGGAP